jgi:hypothetical protein
MSKANLLVSSPEQVQWFSPEGIYKDAILRAANIEPTGELPLQNPFCVNNVGD